MVFSFLSLFFPTLAVMNDKLASSLFIATICQLHRPLSQGQPQRQRVAANTKYQ
ncbi:hypothetical protein [Colwellia sp. 75C3]|uniref:hypothetical protein n=1 Tax=Colwellia sp. 75C3 TaxID=888425 RepID=UPI0012FEF191|nr:hypothetical protein [Colwellia sp. 75C3]